MKNIKSILIAFLIIFCFLIIRISYNNTPSYSIFSSLIAICYQSIDKGWDFSITNFTMNFTYLIIEFLFVSTCLIIASIFKKKNLIIASSALFLGLWIFWGYIYKPYIEIDLYILSSIPFLISIIIMMAYLLKKEKFII